MSLVEINNLTKRFGGLVANDRINVKIEEGEIVGLIGPNGAGKTTLFNCIAGLYPPDEGSVCFAGKDVTGFPPERVCKEGVARTFQLVKVFKNMTVLDNVMVGAFNRITDANRARKKALEVLEFVGELENKDLRAGSLTVAHKKRVEMARALATSPRLLMLDEAISGLNPKEIDEAVELIGRIHQMGITIFLVEHVMSVIMPISGRIIVLEYGRQIAEGTPQEIATNEEVIKAYLGERYYAAS
jgi:branched-chain amino acid transport system ATP-binding protein